MFSLFLTVSTSLKSFEKCVVLVFTFKRMVQIAKRSFSNEIKKDASNRTIEQNMLANKKLIQIIIIIEGLAIYSVSIPSPKSTRLNRPSTSQRPSVLNWHSGVGGQLHNGMNLAPK